METKRNALKKNGISYLCQENFYGFLNSAWSKLHPTTAHCIATAIIILAGATIKGDLPIVLAHLVRRFHGTSTDPTAIGHSVLSTLSQRLDGLPYQICVSTINSFAVHFGLCGFLQWYFYVRQRDRPEVWKCQPTKFLSWEQEKETIYLGSLCVGIAGITSGFLTCWVLNGGYTTLYFDISDYGVFYFVASIPTIFFILEALQYYYHRMCHWPWFFKHFHRAHHKYKQPTAFAATALHPLDFILLQSIFFLPIFVIPTHFAVFLAISAYFYYYGVLGHSGVALETIWPWEPNTTFHDHHHQYANVNYGLHLKLFDYMHGTLKCDSQLSKDKNESE